MKKGNELKAFIFDEQFRDQLARQILRILLPALTGFAVLALILTLFLHSTQKVPLYISISSVILLWVVFQFSATECIRYTVILVILNGLVNIAINQNLRAPGVIGVPILAVALSAWFYSMRTTIILVIAFFVGYGILAYCLFANIFPEGKALESSNYSIRLFANLIYIGAVVLIPAQILRKIFLQLKQKNRDLEKSLLELNESRSFTTQAVNSSPRIFGWIKPNGVLQFANDTALKIINTKPEDVLGKEFWDTPWFNHDPQQQNKLREVIAEAAQGKPVRTNMLHKTAAGDLLEIDFYASPTFDINGEVATIVVEGADVTDERNSIRQKQKLTEQLHQSQKMDAVGQLAGGVAHDFNNSLAGIIGAAELIQNGHLNLSSQKEFIDLIISSAQRASELTKKLLTFSRKGNKLKSKVDMVKIIQDTMGLLRPTLNKNIAFAVEVKAKQTLIFGDDAMLQNALMNIAINASHVMTNGGVITFTLENLSLDTGYCEASSFEINAGEYLDVSIRDTGFGMTPEIQAHIFEPFFTTKEQGKGTGLGLAAVYGTVQDHQGAITVYSEVNVGTVFHLYFPVSEGNLNEKIEETVELGSGTVLLIDDEQVIQYVASALLISLGYTVMCAENGKVGLEKFYEHRDKIDLVILDMIMPVMGGRETITKLREIDNNIPIIVSSGFAKEEDFLQMTIQGISGSLQKPFRREELAKIVAKHIRK